MNLFVDILKQQVHLWCIDNHIIEDKYKQSYFCRFLSEKEKLKASKLKLKKHRSSYIATRAIIRLILSEYEESVSPSDWVFKKNKHGKPRISNTSLLKNIHFNISHTKGMIVIAVSLDLELGADIEEVNYRRNTDGIVNNFFYDKEKYIYYRLNKKNRIPYFFEIWTLKESYMKACGLGFSMPMDSFFLQKESDGNITINIVKRKMKEDVFFWHKSLNDRYKVSLCMIGSENNQCVVIDKTNFLQNVFINNRYRGQYGK